MFLELTHLAAAVMIGMSPIADEYVNFTPPPATGWQGEILYSDGTLIEEHQSAGSLPVTLEKIPEKFIKALVATEDKRFYSHPGIDKRALAAALLDTLKGNTRGGSGLAQQMVKNTITGGRLTLGRKLTEAVLSLRITATKGRDTVMKSYLENTWFGRGQTSVARAPQAWFAKDWEDLSVSEIAFLAGLPQGASRLDPTRNPERAKARRNHVLSRMQATGDLGYLERIKLANKPLDVVTYKPATHSWAGKAVLSEDISGLLKTSDAREDLSVRTTLDPQWQLISQLALSDGLEKRFPRSTFTKATGEEMDQLAQGDKGVRSALRARASLAPHPVLLSKYENEEWLAVDLLNGEEVSVSLAPGVKANRGDVLNFDIGSRARHRIDFQGAVVALNPQTGKIIASVGGYSPSLSQFDRTSAMRQPGSAIKPFLWAAALELGVLPDAYISNRRTTFYEKGEAWSPRNYDRSQSDPVKMYRGLERSLNIVAANLISHIGPENLAAVVRLTGAYRKKPLQPVLAAALGTSETTLLDLTSGYGALVNDAVPQVPNVIQSVRHSEEMLYETAVDAVEPVLSRRTVLEILAMMRGVVQRGTAYSAMQSIPVAIAGKTGTTQEYKDAWFIGITPHLALGVWVGRDDNKSLGRGITGGTVAGRISADILTKAHQAGLIDANGMRPGLPLPEIDWPPAMFDQAAAAPMNAPVEAPATTPPKRTAVTDSPDTTEASEQNAGYFETFDSGAHLRPW